MAGQTSSLARSLHAHLKLLDQPGRNGKLTEHQLRRGVHRSTRQLEKAIRDYIKTVNDDQDLSGGPSRQTISKPR